MLSFIHPARPDGFMVGPGGHAAAAMFMHGHCSAPFQILNGSGANIASRSMFNRKTETIRGRDGRGFGHGSSRSAGGCSSAVADGICYCGGSRSLFILTVGKCWIMGIRFCNKNLLLN